MLITRLITKQLGSRVSFNCFASDKFAKYNFEDPLNLESLLTEEEKMVLM